VLVSGGNRGLGREIGRQLAENGDRVVLGGRDEASAEEAAAELRSGGLDVSAVQLDVTDPGSVDAARARIESDHGRLDVLVNNAGVTGETATSGGEADLDSVRETLETNTFGAWRLTQAMLPLLRASGHARVVNLSSGMGQLDDMGGGAPAYRLSKAGLNVLTRVFASEEAEAGLLVNSVCPGWVRTDMGGEHARSSIEEGADTAVWLAQLPDDGPTGGFFRYREPIPW
jgi:NAD(P)-dependent dehydrogenase (short-subunit alcohol dehydrogenase family)